MVVDEDNRSIGDHRLLAIRSGRRAWQTAISPPLLDPGINGFVEMQAAAEQPRNSRLRQIIACRAEASGRDNRAGALERVTNRAYNIRRGVTDRSPTGELYADTGQLTCQVGSVRIDCEAEEKPSRNGDQLEYANSPPYRRRYCARE